MRRFGTIIFVLGMTLLGTLFIEKVLNLEVEPYYVFLLFLLTSSTVGLYDTNKKA
jgi:hypothetical protein